MEQGPAKIIVPEIETERLILRELNPDTLKLLFENLDDDELINFLCLRSREELDVEKEKYKSGYTTCDISYKVWKLIDKAAEVVIGR